MSCPVIELTQQLIRRPSLSPDDAGCQALMIERCVPSVLPWSTWILAIRRTSGHGAVRGRRWRLPDILT